MIETLVTLVVFAMLVAVAFTIIFLERLFAVVLLSAVFSLLTAILFVILDAVDVAFTEAAVGAGVTTVLMLGTIALTRKETPKRTRSDVLPFLVVAVTGATLVYATLDMPSFGSLDAPANAYIRPDYIERTVTEIDIPNVVTAILASYRAFDTLGEAAVVFVAGAGVLLLLGGLARRRDETDEVDE
ncbi:MAG: DUF4040 domain-containing protein [Pseudomonadota bacterium]